MRPRPRRTPPSHLHPMRVVTRRTGLSADLLRVWERRHDVVKPSRSESGRRLYSDEDIERLGLLYRATLAGRGIGQLARLSTPELAELARKDADADTVRRAAAPPAPRAASSRSDAADMLDECFRAIERLDAGALDGALRRASILLPILPFLEELIEPLAERVGTLWQGGSLRPAHGHLALVAMRRALDHVIEGSASGAGRPSIVVATPAGQMHELGAMSAAACAATVGWRVTYLGAGLPAEDIAWAAERTRARAVALSIVHPTGDRALANELRRLGELLPKGVTLLVGGGAAAGYAPALEAIGAEPAADLSALRSRLRSVGRGGERAR